jgi:hypothetical protein
MADAVKVAGKVLKGTAPDTDIAKQHTQFEKIMAAIKNIDEQRGQIFSLLDKDAQRCEAALAAKRTVITKAPGGPKAPPVPE